MGQEWYRDAFNITDPIWYEPLNEVAPAEVEQCLRLLALPPGSKVLDLCCGQGRHAVELALRGYQVTGLDISSERLALARQRATQAQVNVEWVQADMRQMPPGGYAAVLSLYTSFGYLDTDADNLQVLHVIREALAPGGSVLIEVDNRDHVISQPSRQWGEYSGLLWVEENRFDVLTSRNHLFYEGLNRKTGQAFQQRISYRLFSAHELLGMVQAARLRTVGCWGSLEGTPLAWNSPRLVIRAERPSG
ncbi:class I SAM-dependent methyltransferase [Stigmatella aurantiaca]|uniref:Methyltransferase n=1 Tax=Stigmatella aurantiaca (strain DW4/3-1) TaxID=378806 RepID=Q08RQ2_STIAD|nr:class I SAM-dependent methyltransferase [Stigmatella aurantiaca]ADO72043.1 Methyltransferase type 11 domain protein [Stigmatella aurantiaca DW4/3-1]EAU63159.1 methyltransferase [Stigmatella aurantiaca DW4/3-1]